MKLSLTIATLATLFLSTSVQAKEETSAPHRGLKGGKKNKGGPDTYFALLSAAQEVPGCMSTALGNAVATVDGDQFCIRLSYDGLSGPELFSHVHGPAAIGETGPVVFTMDMTTQKTQCFTLSKDNMKAIENEEYYFNVHSDMCPGGEIRGQILEA
jgi:hypothetical protein